ncbi:hypothetical protein [Kingella oralis]|uniref:Uncharacterized protein n=1 Tax=Kingella oralis ATCC 51147 TaxID=629741 RepID=C4GML9_9NEIS|nr:hypothetical protein GCWU000324_02953 [Kingella oralis ATCC 51147]
MPICTGENRQYSLRPARPLNTAYCFNTAKYSSIYPSLCFRLPY